jgi:hypothetical protein
MARSYKRKEGQAVFTASTQSRIELSRNYHVQQLLCRLVVNHDNSTASFKNEDFANLINSIQIVANGNKTIKHTDVRKMIYNAVFGAGQRMKSTVVTADGSAKVSTIYFSIDFTRKGMVRPLDTVENAALYTTFDMLIDWASAANVGTGVTINSATLSVTSNQMVGYTRNVGERIAHSIETQLVEEITSTTSEFQINLPVNKIYQKILIAATVDGNRNADLVKGVKLKSGTTVFAELTAEDLRVFNSDAMRIKDENDTLGLYLLNFIERGRNSDALNTQQGFNTLELILDVEKQPGTNKVTVYTDEMDIEQLVENKG